MSSSCSQAENLNLSQTRSFLLYPNPLGCGLVEKSYGGPCLRWEVDNITRTISGSTTKAYAWNYASNDRCEVGETEDVPGTETATIRYKELCEKGAIPLWNTLGACPIYATTNFGTCSLGNGIVDSWSGYSEVVCIKPASQSRGRRSSYDAASDEISGELTGEILSMYDVSTVYFSEISMTGMFCTDADIEFCDFAFGCRRGCGSVVCGCLTPCDDGTRSMYVPFNCPGSNTQFLWWTTNGGLTDKSTPLPLPEGAPATSSCPKICTSNGKIYVLGHMDPPVLMQADIDDYGNPENLTVITSLGTTGEPAALCCNGSTVHILVSDPVNGASYWQYGPGLETSQPIHMFEPAANMNNLNCCGNSLYVSGDNGAAAVSLDGGAGWNDITVPAELTGNVTDITYTDGYLWISDNAGGSWFSQDDGFTWTKVTITSNPIGGFNFNGDFGWAADTTGAPISTWLAGGTSGAWWTNSKKRVASWPTGCTAQKVWTPSCADMTIAANTVAAIADCGGETKLLVGRHKVGCGS